MGFLWSSAFLLWFEEVPRFFGGSPSTFLIAEWN